MAAHEDVEAQAKTKKMCYYVYWLKKKITSYLLVFKRKISSQTKKHNYLPRPSYQKVRIPSRFLNKKQMARMEEKLLDRLVIHHLVEYLLSATSAVLEAVAALKIRLASSPACSIMMGLWSSNAMKGFLGVSCSAVTCDYVPFTAFLALHEMQKNPTAAAVFAEYESVIEDWEINKKVNVSKMKSFC
ncbi:Uncharacterized protein APZ42_012923 [Daphnia magna]|uniref:Uncharacterized protein n=1 Tax=Daphnia magna TaxID=35525 RepID=A0A162RCH4_9CRUS|nr:Uncharacterized protein APZ42_012923 [Daphnia magna]